MRPVLSLYASLYQHLFGELTISGFSQMSTFIPDIYQHVYFQSLDPDSSYIPDVYDELLTQAEIQGNINKTNSTWPLIRLLLRGFAVKKIK